MSFCVAIYTFEDQLIKQKSPIQSYVSLVLLHQNEKNLYFKDIITSYLYFRQNFPTDHVHQECLPHRLRPHRVRQLLRQPRGGREVHQPRAVGHSGAGVIRQAQASILSGNSKNIGKYMFGKYSFLLLYKRARVVDCSVNETCHDGNLWKVNLLIHQANVGLVDISICHCCHATDVELILL